MLTKQVRELERQADEALANAARVNNRLKVRDLGPDYYAFGGHGDVWSDTAHIYKSGEGNLCGRPALSSNWVAIEQIEYIGCPTCLAKYNR